nr:hypothetical protein KPHV_05210 [Kitasatospora purpeofusca]
MPIGTFTELTRPLHPCRTTGSEPTARQPVATGVKIGTDCRGSAIRDETETEAGSEQVKADHAGMSSGRDDRVPVLESRGEPDCVGWIDELPIAL